jgi:hypothetical protein
MGESRDYPKCMFHYSGETTTVKDAEEEASLGGGWSGHPTDFEPYQGPRRVDAGNDPCKWVDQWQVEGLPESERPKIKAQLMRTHAAFWRAPDASHADIQAMILAFDGVARVLSGAGILNKQHLEKDIPELVWDSAIAGGWWRLASETRQRMFPTKLGRYWVWLDESRDWNQLFALESMEWQARLLEAPVTDPPELPKSHKLGKHTLSAPGPTSTRPRAQQWEDLRISFLSEERVQNWIANQPETCNYAEMGFADRRSGKPSKSWALLLLLAQHEGIIPTTGRGAQQWAAIEQQIARTKKLLKNFFGISDDPLPLVKGVGYRLRCKIECAPSFNK